MKKIFKKSIIFFMGILLISTSAIALTNAQGNQSTLEEFGFKTSNTQRKQPTLEKFGFKIKGKKSNRKNQNSPKASRGVFKPAPINSYIIIPICLNHNENTSKTDFYNLIKRYISSFKSVQQKKNL